MEPGPTRDAAHSPNNVLSSSPTALSQLCPGSAGTILCTWVFQLTPASTSQCRGIPLSWLCQEPHTQCPFYSEIHHCKDLLFFNVFLLHWHWLIYFTVLHSTGM